MSLEQELPLIAGERHVVASLDGNPTQVMMALSIEAAHSPQSERQD